MPTVKWFLGWALSELVEDALDHGGGEFLGREPVASADHLLRDAHFGERGDDVAVERLAGGAGFLGAVEDGDGFDALGDGGDEGLDGERPEQADFEQADLFAGGEHGFHGLVGHFRAGAHHNDDALGIGRADVIEQVVLAAGDPGELVHRVLHDGGGGQVVRIAGFARLEVDVGILRGAADDGTVGGERAGAVGEDQILVDHGAHVVGAKAARPWRLHARCGSRRRSAGRGGALPGWRPGRSAPCP